MKAFIDTNVILENLCDRLLAQDAQKVMHAIDTRAVEGYINTCSIGNITYVAEIQLKRIYSDKERRIAVLRKILQQLLQTMRVVSQTNSDLIAAASDKSFTDLEDSYQYQACVKEGCDVLVTINTKDYPKDTAIPVVHLSDFVQTYLQTSQND